MGGRNRGLRVFQFVAFSYFFSQGILAVVVPLYTRGFGFSLSEIGGVMGSFWVGTALVKVFAGRHSDLVGRRPYLAGTLALAAVLKLLYLVVRQPVPFLVLMAAEGLARGPLQRHKVAAHHGTDPRGTAGQRIRPHRGGERCRQLTG